jgi:hypothetical protein
VGVDRIEFHYTTRELTLVLGWLDATVYYKNGFRRSDYLLAGTLRRWVHGAQVKLDRWSGRSRGSTVFAWMG